MKTIETSLLLYCLLFTVFLTTTAALGIDQGGSPTFVIIMLPLVGFFLMELKKTTKIKKNNDSNLSLKKLSVFTLLLFILAAVGASSFAYNQKAADIKQEGAKNTPIIVKSPPTVIGKVEIVNDTKESVNVYNEKDSKSEVLFSANVGDIYDYIEHKNGWITILYEDGETGHINEIYTATIIQ